LDIRVATTDVTAYRGDALVVNLFEGVKQPGGATGAVDRALGGAIAALIKDGEIKGKWSERTVVHTLGKIPAERVLVTGLGKQAEFTVDRARAVIGEALRHLRRLGVRRAATILHGAGAGGFAAEAAAQATAEGAILGLYRFLRYKKNDDEADRKEISELRILERDAAKVAGIRAGVAKGRILAEAANFARDLVNEPGNVLTPPELANRAAAMARRARLRVTILRPPEMRRLGMGGLLGVARGSQEPPRLIVLEHRGGRRGGPTLGLVGKGVTFDSGGISIKPAERMEEMKGDMAGAAAMIAAMQAIAALKVPLHVLAVTPCTENLPSGTALKPGDVIRAMNGKAMEIINTDAEGRLILADALCYARKLGATHLVDAATLTGACVVALGHFRTGAFTNDEEWLAQVRAASEEAGEKIWQLPMDPEYDELIKAETGEIKNTGGRWGGAITAAKFLENFVEKTPWVHLDIAGTSDTDKEKGYTVKGATGVPVRTLVTLALRLAQAK
jgi:leucyl aminopeptidase